MRQLRSLKVRRALGLALRGAMLGFMAKPATARIQWTPFHAIIKADICHGAPILNRGAQLVGLEKSRSDFALPGRLVVMVADKSVLRPDDSGAGTFHGKLTSHHPRPRCGPSFLDDELSFLLETLAWKFDGHVPTHFHLLISMIEAPGRFTNDRRNGALVGS